MSETHDEQNRICPTCKAYNPIGEATSNLSDLRIVNQGRYIEGNIPCSSCGVDLVVTLDPVVFRTNK